MMKRNDVLLEACVESIAGAIKAESAGAHRLELCADLVQDGLSPAVDLFQEVKRQVAIPVKVMIRPRAGDFCYTPDEVRQMIQTIIQFKKMGADGLVLGCLTRDKKVDFSTLQILVQNARPLPVTFHKAIDLVVDPLESLQKLKGIKGLNSVLSSGAAPTAIQGVALLQQMIKLAAADFTIIAAGKITSQNLTAVHRLIGAAEYHGRRIV